MREQSCSIELVSDQTIRQLTTMSIELWPDCNYDEEKNEWQQLIHVKDHYCALAKLDGEYTGFIHISIRHDYIEGADSNPTAYLEAIYVKHAYRNKQIATALLSSGEAWARSKGMHQLASDTEIDNQISQLFHQQSGFREVNRIVCFIKTIH